MENHPDPIGRLFQLAKVASPRPPSLEPRPGFVTRVLARARDVTPENPWARLAIGALPIGAAVALLCLVIPALPPREPRVPEHHQLAGVLIQTALEP